MTARRRLRVDRLPPVVLSRRGGKSAAALSAEQRLRRIEPSDASWGAARRKGLPEQNLTLPCRSSSFRPLARQCRRPFRARGAFHRKRPRERSCESPTWSAAPLAGGDSRRTPSSMFENIDQASGSFTLASDLEAACAPSASADLCFHEHACGPLEHPRPPGVRSGRLPGSTELPRSRAITEWASRSGAEEHRSSALPATMARHGDFAPTPAAFGRLLSRPSPFHPARSGAGRGGYRHRAAATAGRRGALAGQRRREGRATPGFREEARCSPARGTFHQKVVRERTKAADGQRAGRPRRRRLFHWPGARAGGRPRGTGQLGQSGAETGEPASFFDRPQRPL